MPNTAPDLRRTSMSTRKRDPWVDVKTYHGLPADQVIPALEKINVAMCDLEVAVKEAAQLTGMNWYKTPRRIKKLRQRLQMDLAEQKDSQNKPADESNMDTVSPSRNG